jgi:hypothetical protein
MSFELSAIGAIKMLDLNRTGFSKLGHRGFIIAVGRSLSSFGMTSGKRGMTRFESTHTLEIPLLNALTPLMIPFKG